MLADFQGQVDLMAFQSASICPFEGGEGIMNSLIVLQCYFLFYFLILESRDLVKGGTEVVSCAGFLYSSHVPESLSPSCLGR